jgi:hypothetical protein
MSGETPAVFRATSPTVSDSSRAGCGRKLCRGHSTSNIHLSMGDERTVGDPNMDVARVFAEYLSPAPPLPASLAEPDRRAALVDAIDGEPVWLGTHAIVPEDVSVVLGPVLAQEVNILAVTARSAARALEIAERTAAFIPEVTNTRTRVSISLRLWSGCMSAAKTIAQETRSGPNTPEGRRRIFAEIIDPIAENDPKSGTSY